MKNVMLELEQLRAKHGVKPGKRGSKKSLCPANFPNLKTESKTVLSNTIEKGGFKKDITNEYKWRKGKEEKAETIAEIERKKSRIRPHFSKSAYGYATDGDNQSGLSIYKKGG